MGLFTEKVISDTKEVLQAMDERVKMTYFTQEMECEPCTSASLFAEEFAALSDHILMEKKDFLADRDLAQKLDVHHIPALVLHRPGDDRPAVRYYGIPGGYEFGAFLRTVVLFSTGKMEQPLDRAALDAIDREVNLKTFVLATCPSCPVMAYLTNSLAYASAKVTTEIIEANTFVDLATRYTVGTVPKIVINDSTEVVGVMPPEELLRKIITH